MIYTNPDSFLDVVISKLKNADDEVESLLSYSPSDFENKSAENMKENTAVPESPVKKTKQVKNNILMDSPIKNTNQEFIDFVRKSPKKQLRFSTDDIVKESPKKKLLFSNDDDKKSPMKGIILIILNSF